MNDEVTALSVGHGPLDSLELLVTDTAAHDELLEQLTGRSRGHGPSTDVAGWVP